MGTSRSPEQGWRVSVDIFSGRPNPSWAIAESVGRRLASEWQALPVWTGKRPAAPPLGYRGIRVAAPDGRVWLAFEGIVSLDGDEVRKDASRSFERSVIKSAPAGTLPEIAI